MRKIIFHRRAAKYLRRMSKERAALVRDALNVVAALEEIGSHPNVKQMKGDMSAWARLRVGSYRAIIQVTIVVDGEELYVDALGTRGDIYKG